MNKEQIIDEAYENYVNWWVSYGSGYYEIKTKSGSYCFPISRTVLKIIEE